MHFVYPPRPRGKLDPLSLPDYEATGKWVAQWKYNGTRNLVYIGADRSVKLYYGRNGKPHKQYQLTAAMKQEILSLNLESGKGYVLDSELMHAKTTDLKGTIVLYDVLWAGNYLFGSTVQARLDLLADICHNPTQMEPNGRALAITEHLWMAPTFTGDFAARFQEAVPDDAREGLVLRRTDGELFDRGGKEYEVDWQLRCRKPHSGANYII